MKLSQESTLEILKMALGMGQSEIKDITSGDWKIVVLQRGWVVVGRYFREGYDCRLEDASVIRQWGTTKGLGEIALNGPTSETVLDKCGTARFNVGAEVCKIDCKTSNW